MRDFFVGLGIIFAILIGVFALCYFVGCKEVEYKDPIPVKHTFGAMILDRPTETYPNAPELEKTWKE